MKNNDVCSNRAYELLERLSYTRVSCTEEETRTADALRSEVLKEGVPDLASSVITNYYKGP